MLFARDSACGVVVDGWVVLRSYVYTKCRPLDPFLSNRHDRHPVHFLLLLLPLWRSSIVFPWIRFPWSSSGRWAACVRSQFRLKRRYVPSEDLQNRPAAVASCSVFLDTIEQLARESFCLAIVVRRVCRCLFAIGFVRLLVDTGTAPSLTGAGFGWLCNRRCLPAGDQKEAR